MQEAAILKERIAAAQATNDISTLLNLVVDSGALSGDDFIDKTLGQLRCLYYMYLDTFHMRPKDLLDMVDGMLYIDCKNYIQRQELDRLKRQQEQSNGKRAH